MTLCFELAGAILGFRIFLTIRFSGALEISIFQSIAAFNNPAFDILGGMQNPIPYQSDVPLKHDDLRAYYLSAALAF